MMEMAKVIFENVTKKFSSVIAVNKMNLEINDKEFLVLLGPSGCGKSTTLRMVAGLETPTEGNIYIGDTIVNDFSPKDRNVAMVFQSYALYPHKNVYENLAFPLKAKKVPKDEIRKRVRGVADLLGIGNLLDRRPRELSGGQKQRVALGRALVREPQVFLLDEPLSNIDAKLRIQMRAELQKLHRKLKATMIYVTHDQVEAMTIGERIAILNNGLLEQVDTPSGTYRKPKNMFVGGFVGAPPMNMLEGSIKKKNGSIIIDLGDFTYKPSNGGGELMRGAGTSEVVLGMRPEDIAITKRNKQNAIRAKIDVLELVGKELIVHLMVGEKPIVVVTTPTQRLKIGEEVWLLPDEKKIYFFDKKSGKNILY